MQATKKILAASILLLYLFFCYQMLGITLQYLPYDTDVAFLRIKQDFIHLDYYRIAFFAHVYASIFVLLAGFTQFSNSLRRRFPALHRRAGWFYAMLVLFVAAPSGFVIAVHANGGFSAQIAFCLLAVLWIYFTFKAVQTIRRGQVAAHQAWMVRSFALTLSAITLRFWKLILVAIFQPRPMDVYIMVAWLGWTLNLLVAELIIRYFIQHKKQLE